LDGGRRKGYWLAQTGIAGAVAGRGVPNLANCALTTERDAAIIDRLCWVYLFDRNFSIVVVNSQTLAINVFDAVVCDIGAQYLKNETLNLERINPP
jgi:hypothetical protein